MPEPGGRATFLAPGLQGGLAFSGNVKYASTDILPLTLHSFCSFTPRSHATIETNKEELGRGQRVRSTSMNRDEAQTDCENHYRRKSS